jgi:hypothetical protein
MVRMLLTGRIVCSTGHTNVGKRGRSWLGVDRRGRRSSKEVDCDILAQGLIGLIEYSSSRYTFFSESSSAKDYRVKRA